MGVGQGWGLRQARLSHSIDCAGILKLRNSDIELRKGETDIGRKNTRVRLVFRVHIPQPNGRTLSLQVASNPIECCECPAPCRPVSRPRASPAGPFPSHSPQHSTPPQGVCYVVTPILTARLPTASGSILACSFVSDLNISQVSLTAPPSRPPVAPPSRPPSAPRPLPHSPSLPHGPLSLDPPVQSPDGHPQAVGSAAGGSSFLTYGLSP